MGDRQPRNKHLVKLRVGSAMAFVLFALLFRQGPWWIDGAHIQRDVGLCRSIDFSPS